MGIIKFGGKYMSKIQKFFFTQSIFPFETLIAFYCIYGGISGALEWGIVNGIFATSVGRLTALIFNLWYSIAGLCIFLGIGLRRREIEVFGLISMITSLLIRTIVISFVAGIDDRVINTYVINVAFMATCVIRIWTLFHYLVVVHVMDNNNGTPVAGVIK